MAKVFYHKADMDGLCSGAILYKYLSPITKVEMIGMDYGDTYDFDNIKLNELVYVVDYCFEPFEKMLELRGKGNLVWIDHHISQIREARRHGFRKGKLGDDDNTKSAAELVWEYVYPDIPVPTGVKYISLWDTWHHNFEPNCLAYQLGASSLLNTPEHSDWGMVFSDNKAFTQAMIEDGKVIQRFIDSGNAKYAEAHAFEIEFEGYPTVVQNLGFGSSMRFKTVYNPEKHGLMMAFARRPNFWKFSIYTQRNDIDCSAIAKKYGGGGHLQAAGFEIRSDELPFKFPKSE